MITESQYKKLVLSLGCIVTGEQDPDPHHVKCFFHGAGRVSDWLIIPLANRLHTGQTDAYHNNKALFEDRYGREVDLLARTIQRVAEKLAEKRIKGKI